PQEFLHGGVKVAQWGGSDATDGLVAVRQDALVPVSRPDDAGVRLLPQLLRQRVSELIELVQHPVAVEPLADRVDVASEQAGLAEQLKDAVGPENGFLELLVAYAALAVGQQVHDQAAQMVGASGVVGREGAGKIRDPAADVGTGL